ncbi:LTA synthase family protein [Eubacterium pyruvativorans]|uniref:LTA synthase family protein n=1 Tax=Eubacterium pyruvativorans TaxID=155865 RepID=UPI000889A59B|nr:LTA synthase family protein [Eubacterium pyruvativorans]SDF38168.1 Phosphoglycerol transferase MdoB [Eubacterium pyruvativorans]
MGTKFRNFRNRKFVKNPFIWCLILALIFNLLIETMARNQQPLYGGLYYMVTKPLVFIANTLILYSMLVVSALFRRGTFVVSLVGTFWMIIGIANGVILTQRMTPFTVKDLSAATDGATILTNYFSKLQLIGMGALIVGLVVTFVVLFIKGPKRKEKIPYKKTLAGVLAVILITFGSIFGLIRIGMLNTFFGNLQYAYRDYGVPYCFINTWMNTGIHRPANYSEAAVKRIFSKDQYTGKNETMVLKKNDSAVKEKKPNILFLQLESFVDPERFTNIKLSADPIPYYRSLMKNYSSGSLTVPACGAGTANTEFEVMTGLSVKFFGPGEYPFKSVLKDETAESVPRDLKSIGYGTHAIHDHRAMFYNRNEVFNNLGYDTFTSVEYMSGVQKTPKGWAKDKILTPQIMETLKSTKDRPDYIYTISVQGHGKYPSEPLLSNPQIRVTGAKDEETKNKYEYYVNQVHEMDQFVKQLTTELKKLDEPTVLVMYGDHIPALDIKEDTYRAKDLYQTQYVIWSNFPMKAVHKDMTAYQLSADVLNRVGIHVGTTTIYHQTKNHHGKNYLPDLKMLGYDMLYGKDYIYGGKNPFHKAGMKMGVKKIKVLSVEEVAGQYYIKGQNFTECSKISLDGKVLKTTYLTPSLLKLRGKVDPEDVKRMKVSQTDKTNETILTTTE